MKFRYYKETDSLYIELSDRAGAETKTAAPGVVLDFDDDGSLVGIDIDQASRLTNLARFETDRLPSPSPAEAN